jgi:quaternary ammonium compound-resistance protein SugE
MNWTILVVAGLFEIGWAIGLKYTEGFTRFWPTLGTVLAMLISIGLLGIAMKSLPVGTAYAVWVGVGAVGTAILGIVLLGEPANAGRLASLEKQNPAFIFYAKNYVISVSQCFASRVCSRIGWVQCATCRDS